jgi:Fe-S-cluster formation regulator IscX/YfhJ
MPFGKFRDMENLSEERRRALQESMQSMPVAELRKVVKELSEFEGDPSQQKILEIIETHPEEGFYRAVSQEGAIILYCPGENTGVWFLPGSGMGPLPEEARRQMKEAISASCYRNRLKPT